MLIPQILGVRPACQQIQPSLSRATPGLRFQISGANEIGKFFFFWAQGFGTDTPRVLSELGRDALQFGGRGGLSTTDGCH